MKKLLLFMMLPLLAISLISCSSDDEDNGKNGEEPTKLVKSIRYNHYDDSDSYIATCEYDNRNRLIRVKQVENCCPEDIIFTYEYKDNEIIITHEDFGSSSPRETTFFYFDDNEYLTNLSSYSGVGDNVTQDYYYNTDGYLSKLDRGHGWTTEYFWADGHHIREESTRNSITYQYNDKPDKMNISIAYIRRYIDVYTDSPVELKFKGIHSKNCLVKESYGGGYEREYEYEYEYEYDDDGYPIKITMIWGGGSISTFYITYY